MFGSAVGAASVSRDDAVGGRVGAPAATVGRGVGPATADPAHHAAPQLPSQFPCDAPQNSEASAKSSHASHVDAV